MLVNKAADRQWKATDHAGIERSLFRNNDTGGRSSVVRLVQGSRFPRHAHEGTEEVVVLAGTVRIGGVELARGRLPLHDARRGARRRRGHRRDDLRVVAARDAAGRVTLRALAVVLAASLALAAPAAAQDSVKVRYVPSYPPPDRSSEVVHVRCRASRRATPGRELDIDRYFAAVRGDRRRRAPPGSLGQRHSRRRVGRARDRAGRPAPRPRQRLGPGRPGAARERRGRRPAHRRGIPQAARPHGRACEAHARRHAVTKRVARPSAGGRPAVTR